LYFKGGVFRSRPIAFFIFALHVKIKAKKNRRKLNSEPNDRTNDSLILKPSGSDKEDTDDEKYCTMKRLNLYDFSEIDDFKSHLIF